MHRWLSAVWEIPAHIVVVHPAALSPEISKPRNFALHTRYRIRHKSPPDVHCASCTTYSLCFELGAAFWDACGV